MITLLDREIGEDHVLSLAASGLSQAKIAAVLNEQLGTELTSYYICKYLHDTEDRENRYREAQIVAAHALAGRIQDVSEEVLDGKRDPASARVASDNWKWLAGRWNQSVYGDKQQLDVKLADVTQLHIQAMQDRMRTVSKAKDDSVVAKDDSVVAIQDTNTALPARA